MRLRAMLMLGLSLRVLQGAAFLASTTCFMVAVYGQAEWLSHAAAGLGIGFGAAGLAGLLHRRRLERGRRS